jgi:hypothetical protein
MNELLKMSVQSAALAAALCTACWAAPFVPQSDAEMVERLPQRIGTAEERRQQREARLRLRERPTQLPLALQLAREALDRARRLGDPRELGQAEAALAPWWNLAAPPPAVRLLRATVRQSQHEFGPALVDLDALRADAAAPLQVQAQAELTRASVLQVQGRWQEAAQGCERLAGPHYATLGAAVQLPAQACLAELASLQGRAPQADLRLQALSREAKDNASWLTLVRAELAERRGLDAAGALFQQALQADGGSPDVYTLAAYADWLLNRGRGPEVLRLLQGREDADALLLRLALALKQGHQPGADTAIATLGGRFDAAAQRGDRSHGREQARFELDLKGNAAAALSFAQANWAVQKEPADALLLVRAAQAAGQSAAAEPVWQRLRETGGEDARLKRLADGKARP